MIPMQRANRNAWRNFPPTISKNKLKLHSLHKKNNFLYFLLHRKPLFVFYLRSYHTISLYLLEEILIILPIPPVFLCKKAPGTLGSGGHKLVAFCLVHAAHVGSSGSGSSGLLLVGPPHESLSAPAGSPFHLLGRNESARHQGFAKGKPLLWWPTRKPPEHSVPGAINLWRFA